MTAVESSPQRIEIDPQYTKTYASIKNLNKAIEDRGLTGRRHLICWTPEGRCTAVFIGEDNIEVSAIGFMVVS